MEKNPQRTTGSPVINDWQDSFTDKDINKEELNKVVFEIKSIVSSNNYNVKFAGQQYNVEEYLKCSDIFVYLQEKRVMVM